jgi:hypothetical protein
MAANDPFVEQPLPDPAAVYGQAPPLAEELQWIRSRLAEGIRGTESRPDNRIELLRWAAFGDRSVEAAARQVAAYGRDLSPAAVRAWDALYGLQCDLLLALEVLEDHDDVHASRLGPYVPGDFGLALDAASGYIRQEYAALIANSSSRSLSQD